MKYKADLGDISDLKKSIRSEKNLSPIQTAVKILLLKNLLSKEQVTKRLKKLTRE
jgi:hypothetical protein